jgi:ABC-type glycerol-3-phosphate transport system permease component
MSFEFSAAGGLPGQVAMPAAILLTGLVVRNPAAPTWLQNEATSTGAGLVLTVGVCLTIAYAVSGLEGSALPYWAIVLLIVAVPATSTFLLWKALGLGDRLMRAESGHSPFRRMRPSETTIVASV